MRSLGEIAREVLVEQGRNTTHKMAHLLQLGSRAARELNIDVTGQVKSVFLTPNSYRAISVPDDYYDYSKVAVCIGGTIYNLSRNDKMCFPHTRDDCGNLQPEPYSTEDNFNYYLNNAVSSGIGWYYYNAYNEFGEYTGAMYGVGQGVNPFGSYRYNPENREFVLSPNLQNQQILLEYISTGINQTNILIPEEATEACISFILWKLSKGGDRERYKQEYFVNVQTLRLRSFSFTLTEFANSLRRSYRQSPKN